MIWCGTFLHCIISHIDDTLRHEWGDLNKRDEEDGAGGYNSLSTHLLLKYQ